MNDFQQYKTWLKGLNPAPVEDNEKTTASDKRIKGYVTSAFCSDSILGKIIGLNLLKNGYMDSRLADLYIAGKLIRG